MQALRWGIFGAGHIARAFVVEVTRRTPARVYAIASRDPARARAFADALDIPRAFGSYAEMIAAGGIDAVYIATHNDMHADHMALCLEAGLPVLCEKPFTVTAAEAEAVRRLAHAKGVFCMEAMWTRFLPAVRALRDLVRGGELGEVRHLHAELGHRRSAEFHARLFDPARGGGALLDSGAYGLSLAHYLLGAPESVFCEAQRGPTGVDEHVAVTLAYPGAAAQITASLRSTLGNALSVYGSNGWARTNAAISRPEWLRVESGGGPSVARKMGWLRRRLDRPAFNAVAEGWQGLRDAVRQGRWYPVPGRGLWIEAEEVARCLADGVTEHPLMTLRDSVEVMRLIDLARLSADRRQAVPMTANVEAAT